MAELILWETKQAPLSIEEVDANFNNLNTDILSRVSKSDFTGDTVLNLLTEVDGKGSGLDADMIEGFHLSTSAEDSTLVLRDANADVYARKFIGGVSAVGDNVLEGNAKITGGTIVGINDLAIVDGGTGASTSFQARTNLGLQIGKDIQKYSDTLDSISNLSIHPDTIIYFNTDSEVSSSYIGSVGKNILSASTASAARRTIGVTIGADVQAYSAQLSGLSGLGSSTGYIKKTGKSSYSLSNSVLETGDISDSITSTSKTTVSSSYASKLLNDKVNDVQATANSAQNTANSAQNTANSAHSKAYSWTTNHGSNGYTKMPDGTIIQWGYNSSSGTTRTISFPTTFPHYYRSISIQRSYGKDYAETTPKIDSISNNSFTMKWVYTGDSSGSRDAYSFHWIAIGY